MRKALIYLSAFCVSFLTIYSVYYYSKVNSIQQGLVVSADELKHTVIGPGYAAYADKGNAIYLPGLLEAVHYAPAAANPAIWGSATANTIPEASFLSGEGVYGKKLLQSLNDGIEAKYTNHPPIDFGGLKEGDSVVFSYFFEKIELPKGFFWPKQALPFAGSQVRAMLYTNSVKSAVKVRFYKGADGQMALAVPFRDSLEAVYYCGGKATNLAGQYTEASAYMQSAQEYTLSKDEAVLLPDLDFYIEKNHSALEMAQDKLPLAHKALVQDRLKLKTFAFDKDPIDYKGKTIDFNSPTLFFLRKSKDSLPYFAMLIRDPEVLIRR